MLADIRDPEEKPACLQSQGAHSSYALAGVSFYPPKISPTILIDNPFVAAIILLAKSSLSAGGGWRTTLH